MILIIGLRRTGKSSLVLSFLNSLNIDFVFIDVRKVYDDVSKKVHAEKLY
jgi:AAA+ ATPase superfamily predicted ATPase